MTERSGGENLVRIADDLRAVAASGGENGPRRERGHWRRRPDDNRLTIRDRLADDAAHVTDVANQTRKARIRRQRPEFDPRPGGRHAPRGRPRGIGDSRDQYHTGEHFEVPPPVD